jgi:hypothetical protein
MILTERGWNMPKGQGRGWHGDSAGHAKAGRMGGRARGKKRSRNNGR